MHAPFADAARPKPEFYRELVAAADGLTAGESDGIANMANVAALLWQFMPELNWAGFYRAMGDELVLGPFCGKPACIRIPFGQGVCGTVAASGESQLVPDVNAFAGHIACDADSRSELAVPVVRAGAVIAVIDLDAPRTDRFDEADRTGIGHLARLLAERI
ncbi:MAG TPA: GAF domain-containing protein [Thermomicrobiales bacterium]|nr:GAF domain-containing protein [Thermomicrobiales bacterium]